MRIPRARDSAILAYALLNAVLYSAMLPLWEGFDEAFHYAYIQHVSTIGALPVLGEASLSREVQQSLQIVPVSQVVAHDFPGLITFDRYFALPQAERERLRETLLRSPRQFQTEQA